MPVIFTLTFDANTVKQTILSNPYKDYASVLLCEGYKNNNANSINIAKWIVKHPETKLDIIRDVFSCSDLISITPDMSIEKVLTTLSCKNAKMEIQKIEKAYKETGFKFEDCVCNLPKTEVELGKYKAYIMDGQDPRQVMLGYDTDCCQHLDGAGETAMMYGLINPDAGFFVIEDKATGKILAQAETWEYTDKKLVFDNIEFADDRKISQFAPILAKWCETVPYNMVVMGDGYNAMKHKKIKHMCGIEPPINDEIRSLLDGEEPYTDADERCSIIKEDGKVEPYFKEKLDKYLKKNVQKSLG